MRPTLRLLASPVLAACLLAAGCEGRDPVAPSPLQSLDFQLIGYVDDTSFNALSSATIEVLDGAQAGSSTITDSNGRFSLAGAFNRATRLRVTKDGYRSAIQTLESMPMMVFLGTTGPSGNRATITVDADPTCIDLPGEARMRTYAATVVAAPSSSLPVNTTFTAMLTGEGLDSYFHNVFIRVAGNVVTFDLSDNGIEEEVAPEAYLFVGGVGRTPAPAGASAISAALDGQIDYCVVESDPGAAYPCSNHVIARATCRSPNNRMTLTWQ